MKRISVNALEEKAYGQEPDPASIVSESDYTKAYNFYNYNCGRSDIRAFVNEYLKTVGAGTGTVRDLSAVEDAKIPSLYVWLIRMQVRGVNHSPERIAFIEEQTAELRRIGREKLSAKSVLGPVVDIQKSVLGPVVGIQKRIREISGDHIANIDEQIDVFTETGYKKAFSFYEFLRSKKAKAEHMPIVINHYKPLAAELELAVKGTDPDVNEGYRNLSKKQIRAFSDFVNNMIEDCKMFSANQRKTRAPRKRKAKSADQITKNVRYQKSDTSLKLVSIDAVNLVGATEVWTFNTKYCVMSHYVAIDRGGISVKGTSLINFDETSSEKRKIRKPEQFLPTVLSGGAKAATKSFTSLKTKPSACNGRINEFTIILRATK